MSERELEHDHKTEQGEFGDSGAWVTGLPRAWRATATALSLGPAPHGGAGSEQAATRWSPLVHLLTYGLGWSRLDLGLDRWDADGRPVSDPVLSVVQRWWGEDLDYFLAFATSGNVFRHQVGEVLAHRVRSLRLDSRPAPDRYARLRQQPEWEALWGGGTDPLHLTSHWQGPLATRGDALLTDPVRGPDTDGDVVPRAVLVSESYAGWYDALLRAPWPARIDGRRVRVDVVCRPVGWLGRYRRSEATGLWFRGRHADHLRGN